MSTLKNGEKYRKQHDFQLLSSNTHLLHMLIMSEKEEKKKKQACWEYMARRNF